MGWSDGVVRLMGLESNKAAHSIRIPEAADAAITHVTWSRSRLGRRKPVVPKQDGNPWQDVLARELKLDPEGGGADLPRELTFLEVDTALPKLSPLPSGSAGDG